MAIATDGPAPEWKPLRVTSGGVSGDGGVGASAGGAGGRPDRRTAGSVFNRRVTAGRRSRSTFQRPENVLAESDSIVRRDALGEQAQVDRVGAECVLAHGQRFIGFVALADLHGRGPFPRLAHAGVVAGAAHRDRGVLRKLAVQAVGSVDVGQIRRRPPGGGR